MLECYACAKTQNNLKTDDPSVRSVLVDGEEKSAGNGVEYGARNHVWFVDPSDFVQVATQSGSYDHGYHIRNDVDTTLFCSPTFRLVEERDIVCHDRANHHDAESGNTSAKLCSEL